MFQFIFRFENYCTALCYLLFRNIFHAMPVFLYTFAWKTFQIFSYVSWQCSILYSCFGMFSDLSNTHLFLCKKPSKWSSSTRFLNFGGFSFSNFLKYLLIFRWRNNSEKNSRVFYFIFFILRFPSYFRALFLLNTASTSCRPFKLSFGSNWVQKQKTSIVGILRF